MTDDLLWSLYQCVVVQDSRLVSNARSWRISKYFVFKLIYVEEERVI